MVLVLRPRPVEAEDVASKVYLLYCKIEGLSAIDYAAAVNELTGLLLVELVDDFAPVAAEILLDPPVKAYDLFVSVTPDDYRYKNVDLEG